MANEPAYNVSEVNKLLWMGVEDYACLGYINDILQEDNKLYTSEERNLINTYQTEIIKEINKNYGNN